MRKKGSATITSLDAKRLQKTLDKKRKLEDLRKRREHETIELVVGRHPGCGGNLLYNSWFTSAIPLLDESLEEDSPKREEARCFCDKCGALFDPYFKPYREKIDAYRAGD